MVDVANEATYRRPCNGGGVYLLFQKMGVQWHCFNDFNVLSPQGWCRLEMWCSILSPSEKPFLVVKGG